MRLGSKGVAAAIALTLVAAHLILGGPASAKRVFWLLTRHRALASDDSAWVTENVPSAAAVRAVNSSAPPDARLIVYGTSSDAALDVAFYCFPRPVEFRQSSPSATLRVAAVGPGLWAVWLPAGGGR